jgi:RNA polymerase sigma factor (sigma-70 family)
MNVVEPTSGRTVGDQPVPSTFDAFYQERLARTVRQVSLMVGSVAAAEDIAHDAFVQVYDRWDRITDPGGYLYRCVSNGAIRHLRHRDRQGGRVIELAVPTSPIEFVEVAEALGRLSVEQRIAVVLKYYEDLTDQQIAEAIGCRPGTVGSHLTRGRAILREELGP